MATKHNERFMSSKIRCKYLFSELIVGGFKIVCVRILLWVYFLFVLPALLPWMISSAKLSGPVSAWCILVCGLLEQKAGHFEHYRPSLSTVQGSGKSNLHFNMGASVRSGNEQKQRSSFEIPEGRALSNHFWHPLNREALPYCSPLTNKLDLLSCTYWYIPQIYYYYFFTVCLAEHKHSQIIFIQWWVLILRQTSKMINISTEVWPKHISLWIVEEISPVTFSKAAAVCLCSSNEGSSLASDIFCPGLRL